MQAQRVSLWAPPLRASGPQLWPHVLWHSQSHPGSRGSQVALLPLPLGASKSSSWSICGGPQPQVPVGKSHPRGFLRHLRCLLGLPVSLASPPVPSVSNRELCPPHSPGLICSLLSLEPAHCLAHSWCSINTRVGPNLPTDTTVVLSLLVRQTLNAAHQSVCGENRTTSSDGSAGG